MKVLVTGADGFVGRWLVPRLRELGHSVLAAAGGRADGEAGSLTLDLRDADSVRAAAARDPDWVVHLAGVSSVSASIADPVGTWEVNALGTTHLVEALAERRAKAGSDPVVLVVSSAEVYGPGKRDPRLETDEVAPVTPYATSKAAAEAGSLDVAKRTGLRVIVARPFPHIGRGQATRFVVPGFIERIRLAKQMGAPVVNTGNLEPVRDFLDVRDVVDAYIALLERGASGEVYNVATGEGIRLEDLFYTIAELVKYRVIPERDASLARASDIPHLVGNSGKLRAATGWAPRFSLEQTLQSMLDAEAH
ncbi:MAG TPA: NAD-dependent epimerase/dehydratase family protein [Gemmatimonadales bacterium]|nr:NAD-dependent epimerase/dehydratase family protein [Gemmatimonadales bacterium]